MSAHLLVTLGALAVAALGAAIAVGRTPTFFIAFLIASGALVPSTHFVFDGPIAKLRTPGVVRELVEEVPLLAAAVKVTPELSAQLEKSATNMLRAGASEDDRREVLVDMAEHWVASHLHTFAARASDEAALAYVNAMANIIDALADQGERECDDFLQPKPRTAALPLADRVGTDLAGEFARTVAALAETAAAGAGAPITNAEAEHELHAVSAPWNAARRAATNARDAPAATPCGMLRSVYRTATDRSGRTARAVLIAVHADLEWAAPPRQSAPRHRD